MFTEMCNEKCDPADTEYCNGVCVDIRIKGLRQGTHGVSIREYGAVGYPDVKGGVGCSDAALGKNFDPLGSNHGLPNYRTLYESQIDPIVDSSDPRGRRKHGDMGNIV